MRIAICQDRVTLCVAKEQSFSQRWLARTRELGHEGVSISLDQPDLIERIRECDGFLWRFTHDPATRKRAMRLLPAIEHGTGMPVFPDWRTMWHYDDKIAQHQLLTTAGLPTPRTWVFWDPEEARAFCREAAYPLVLKLSIGASSQNVRLLRSPEDAIYWIRRLFSSGAYSLEPTYEYRPRAMLSRARGALNYWFKGLTPDPGLWFDLQKNYVLLQEFLPDNPFDTRVTVVGNRAFGYRRFNRPNDFRSSGSGNFNTNPDEVDLETVRLAFRVARELGTQSVAIDGLRRAQDRVVGEISYTYVSWMVHSCPGHWALCGDPDSGRLEWVGGQMWPQDAILEDFISTAQSCRRTNSR
jgi:glutathione synthase/RimK-type ligase-like ATP-grasp enzyme